MNTSVSLVRRKIESRNSCSRLPATCPMRESPFCYEDGPVYVYAGQVADMGGRVDHQFLFWITLGKAEPIIAYFRQADLFITGFNIIGILLYFFLIFLLNLLIFLLLYGYVAVCGRCEWLKK